MMAVIPAAAAERPAEAYLGRVQAGVGELATLLPDYSAHAIWAADHLAAGGTLWIAGDRGFVMEGLGRAGGFMGLKWLQSAGEVKKGDVVLIGERSSITQTAGDLAEAAGQVEALAILMGPVPPDVEGLVLHMPVPADPPQAEQLPATSPILAAALWTFSAELLSALTRLGKMPPMYQSVLVPGGRERNAKHLDLTWEPGTPTPIQPGLLGRTYLARLGNILRRLRATQLDKIEAAGKMAAGAIQSGHTAWYGCLGHLPPELPGQPGDPGVLKPLTMAEPDKLGECVKPGDVILYVGYYEPYGPWVEKAHELGAKIATVVSGTPERRAEDMGADININACWPFGDALIEVPGYDIKVLPPSGVVSAAAYYMFVAETAGALE